MQVKILVKTPLLNHKANAVITVDADENGKPLDNYWRRRLRDAKIDNCCEIVVPEPKKTKKGDK